MKFVAVTVLVPLFLLANVDAASVSMSSSELTLNGNAIIRFFGPKEEIWNGLSNGKNFMIFVIQRRKDVRFLFSWLFFSFFTS